MSLVEVNCKEELHSRNEECTIQNSADHSLSSDYASADEIFGEPPMLPRVGDQYQVEIPALVAESEHLQLQHSPSYTNGMLGANFHIGQGLAVPIMWVHPTCELIGDRLQEFSSSISGGDTGGSVDNLDNKESCLDAKCSAAASGFTPDSLTYSGSLCQSVTFKAESSDKQSEHGKDFTGSTNLESLDSRTSDYQINAGAPSLQSRKTKSYIPLPGSPVTPWSDAESQSFLLALYIFGKNLVQVKKFVDGKEMGDVLSFYYGKFYRSDAHRRWMECRKMKSRKCILGHRIFTSWRQQELLSRILPSRSKEVQDSLLEAVKSFNDGRFCLEEFVFTFRDTVGAQALVEAIGIGKGKQDLTGMILDPVKTNPVISTRPEIPIGKACSSLTSGEIIKFLTGDFRLSKARSNDLFWEAVWPRLLARGWHSEQPKHLCSLTSKNVLVFLMPGIKKFSRKKLAKGDHYFDSVTDVLNKVASEPTLLELEAEGAKEGECQWEADAKLGPNGLPDHQQPCYLRPRVPNCSSELVKFTIVDTSLAQGKAPSKVRELRSLPVDALGNLGPHFSGETNSDSSSEESSSTDVSLNEHEDSDPSMSDVKKVKSNRKHALSKEARCNLSDHSEIDPIRRPPVNGHDFGGWELVNDKKPVTDTKCQFSRRVKSGPPNYLAPESKRQRLSSCKYVGTGRRSHSLPRGHALKKEEQQCELKSLESSKASTVDVEAIQKKISEPVLPQEKLQPRTLIDLNVPFPPDFDTDEPFGIEVEGGQKDLNQKESSCQSETKLKLNDSLVLETNDSVPPEQEPAVNGRRQSTRNRPPTTRALEALACGFLSTKGKGTKNPRSSKLPSRPSRRARKNTESSMPVVDTNLISVSPNGLAPNIAIDEEFSRTTNHGILFDNKRAQSVRKEAHEMLGLL